MDAGKVRTLIPSVGLRADSGSDAPAGRRSDAGTVLPKVAPLVALDALLTSADADLKNEVAGIVARAPTGVVVNLSLPALGADAARQMARTLASASDYTHLDPHKPHPERSLADVADPLRAAAAAAAAPLDRASPQSPASNPTSADVRPDLHLHGLAHAAQASNSRIDTPVQRSGMSAIDQARNTERLAGLAAPTERAALTMPPHFGKMLLGAAILGALIVILL